VISLDTNVIVRFLVEDDPEQAQQARQLVVNALKDSTLLYVPPIVVCEVAWVLRSIYRFKRQAIAAILHRMLRSSFVFGSRKEVIQALQAFEDGRGDFADYLIARTGSTALATFDAKLLKEPGFVHPTRAIAN
jgi:predicted nucleic-acid-binding protein